MARETPLDGDQLEQLVREQHRQLEGLFGGVREALAGPAPEGPEAFAQLREALETHFEQEDRLYFTAIGALRPVLQPQLRLIAVAHARFRDCLERISRDLAGPDADVARQAFERFTEDFARHEAAEESLLQRLGREIEEASAASS